MVLRSRGQRCGRQRVHQLYQILAPRGHIHCLLATAPAHYQTPRLNSTLDFSPIHGRTPPLQMVTLIWKIIPLHRCTVAEIGGCSIFNRLCSCGQSVEIATLPWKIGNAHPNQPSNALHCELNQIAQIFHGQGVFQCRCKCCVTRVLEFQSNQISFQKQITFVPWNPQL